MQDYADIRDHFVESRGYTQEAMGRLSEINESLLKAVDLIIEHVPKSADRSAALRKLWEAKLTIEYALSHG